VTSIEPIAASRQIDTHRAVAAALNAHDIGAILAYYVEDLNVEDFGFGHVCAGKDELRQFAAAWFGLVPDLTVDLHIVRAQEHGTFAEWTLHGTVRGAPAWAAGVDVDGRRFAVRGVSVFDFTGNGRVRCERIYWNFAALLTQLGLLPHPGNEKHGEGAK
jgi:steroid delta-isomerase-like uncharacterized protein